MWRKLRDSVIHIVVGIALFFAAGAARAATITKLDPNNLSNTTPTSQSNLLGHPVKVAVGGAYVYVLTQRGWIFRLNSSGLTDAGCARLPGPLVAPNDPRIPANALAVGTYVYASRHSSTASASEIVRYDPALFPSTSTSPCPSLSPLQTSVAGQVVDLTVDSNGAVYAVNTAGAIFKKNLASFSFFQLATVTISSGNVIAIRAQKRVSSSVVDLYVAISNGDVCRIDATTSPPTILCRSVSSSLVDIGADSNGNMVVANPTTLYRIDPTNVVLLNPTTGLTLTATDLRVVMDSSRVVGVDHPTGDVYVTNLSLATTTSPPSSTKVTPTTSIALDSSFIYVVGGPDGTSEGDPHQRTIDGVRYDFQSAGEFVLLRHSGNLKGQAGGTNVSATYSPEDAAEIQVRQFPVATTANTCVSLNSAIAAQVGKHTVTYEPNLSGEPDPSGLQLRIDHNLVALDPSGVKFGDGGRVVPTSASGGLEIDFPNDDILFITPGWWGSQRKWYLNVNVVPQQHGRGLLGDVPEGSWLPALPDGTSMGPAPTSPHERYVALYERFADAWRVTDKTSLFDYAPGAPTKTFTMRGWPPETGTCSIPGEVPVEGTTEKVAREVCKKVPGDPANCIFDVKVTGLLDIANTYVASRNAQPVPETKTQPEPRCNCRRTIVLLVVLGVLVLLALWIVLNRRKGA
jgi:hypothetical protein